MKRVLAVLLLAACVVNLCIGALAAVVNPGFEFDGQVLEGWDSDSETTDKYIAGVLDESYDSIGMCASLTNLEPNHSRIYQRITGGKPGDCFLITAMVRVKERISGGGAGITAQSVNTAKYGMNTVGSKRVFDKCEWTELSFYVVLGKNTKEFELWLELGTAEEYAEGKAYFDAVSVCKLDSLPEGAEAAVITGPSEKDGTGIYIFAGVVLCIILAGVIAIRRNGVIRVRKKDEKLPAEQDETDEL